MPDSAEEDIEQQVVGIVVPDSLSVLEAHLFPPVGVQHYAVGVQLGSKGLPSVKLKVIIRPVDINMRYWWMVACLLDKYLRAVLTGCLEGLPQHGVQRFLENFVVVEKRY